jgi:hypothetical protein
VYSNSFYAENHFFRLLKAVYTIHDMRKNIIFVYLYLYLYLYIYICVYTYIYTYIRVAGRRKRGGMGGIDDDNNDDVYLNKITENRL